MAGEKKGLQLLDLLVSPFAQRCRIALAEKGLAYEYLEQDLSNKSELLLRSNPVHKKVPVLLHDGRPVCESLIILEYLEEAFPGKGAALLPSDPYTRAQARFWADYADKKVYGCGSQMWQLKGEPLAQAKKETMETLKTMEGELGDKKFFGGEAFGFVDVVFVPFTAWFLSYEWFGELSAEKECPRLAAWAKRCGERESVAKNLPRRRRCTSSSEGSRRSSASNRADRHTFAGGRMRAAGGERIKDFCTVIG